MISPSASAVDPLRLAALDEYGILDSQPEAAFDDLAILARRLCGTAISLISFVDCDRQWFKARAGFEPRQTDLQCSVCAHAVAQRAMLVIPDLSKDGRTRENPLVTDGPRIRFYAGALLETPGGQPLGTLCVIDPAPRPQGLSPEQADDLRRLARQVMTLLEARRVMLGRNDALLKARRAHHDVLLAAEPSEMDGDRLREAVASSLSAQMAGSVGTFDLDLATDWVRVSPQFCRLAGLPPATEYPMAVIEALLAASGGPSIASREERRDGDLLPVVEYLVQRPGEESPVWIERRGEVIEDDDGRPARFVGVITDITERRAAEQRQESLIALGDALQDVRESEGSVVALALRRLGEALGVDRTGFVTLDATERNVVRRDGWTARGAGPEHPDAACLLPSSLGRLREGRSAAYGDVAEEPALAGEQDIFADLGIRAQISVPLMEGGRLSGILFVQSARRRQWSRAEVLFVSAVADRMKAALAKAAAEADCRLLTLELEHRLKTMLAHVQALADQTLEDVADRGAAGSLARRLGVLAEVHEILLQERWSSAPLELLVRGTLVSLDMDGRYETAGPDLLLGSKAALSLSMILHELGANAGRHGALAEAGGAVRIAWQVDRSAADPVFVLSWRETGGQAPKMPVRQGAGLRIIQAGLPGGRATAIRFEPGGLVARFEAPLALMLQS